MKMELSTQQHNSDSNNVSGSMSCLCDLMFSGSDSPGWGWQRDSRESSGAQKRMEHLSRQSGNRFCADCGSPDPKWVSLSFGVFFCIKCSGVHRSLGVHISKVLSVKLDDWTDEEVNSFTNLGGNTIVNIKYEAYVPDVLDKPKPDSSIEQRIDFIRRKYALLQISNVSDQVSYNFPSHHKRSSSGLNCGQDKRQYEKQASRHRSGCPFHSSWGRKNSDCKSSKKSNASLVSNTMAGMVEFVGLIKANVVKGTNLAIRDVMTSDPYVILTLGNQSVKTRVIKSSLNLVWNESLMLSIPDHIPPLEVFYVQLVYDKDTFSSDDFMGDAEIDIQPLDVAAKAYERSTINGSMQLGKSIANGENMLVNDGIINVVDGKVKQEISLRLQNVETGLLDIDLECIPLTQ